MPKERIVDKIYDALKGAALGKPAVAVSRGVDLASFQTSMLPGLVRKYLRVMETAGWIDVDGHTIWLVRDHGPRVQQPDEYAAFKKADRKRQKEFEALAKKHMRNIKRAESSKVRKRPRKSTGSRATSMKKAGA